MIKEINKYIDETIVKQDLTDMSEEEKYGARVGAGAALMLPFAPITVGLRLVGELTSVKKGK